MAHIVIEASHALTRPLSVVLPMVQHATSTLLCPCWRQCAIMASKHQLSPLFFNLLASCKGDRGEDSSLRYCLSPEVTKVQSHLYMTSPARNCLSVSRKVLHFLFRLKLLCKFKSKSHVQTHSKSSFACLAACIQHTLCQELVLAAAKLWGRLERWRSFLESFATRPAATDRSESG